MKIAAFMDDLQTLNLYRDTTLLILQKAQVLGWSCYYFTQQDLVFKSGQAFAHVFEVQFTHTGVLSSLDQIITKSLGMKLLTDFDIILIRKDPPFNSEYMYATYMLDLVAQDKVVISNHPQSLRDCNEKMFTLWFKDCCPETMVSCNISELKQFWQQHQHVIFKPLDGLGGRGIFEVDADGKNLAVILETLTQLETVSIMAQKYIPDILITGDKRIILINGEPAKFACARIPMKGEIRGNFRAGGSAEMVELTVRDKWLCAQIAPTLKARNLHLVGIDVIGDYITEINVTSPSCISDISYATGLDIAGSYLIFLENLYKEKYGHDHPRC